MPDQNVVPITGASSGVGQAAARLLAQRGYKVFGTPSSLTLLDLPARWRRVSPAWDSRHSDFSSSWGCPD